jgi:hypothetical protein
MALLEVKPNQKTVNKDFAHVTGLATQKKTWADFGFGPDGNLYHFKNGGSITPIIAKEVSAQLAGTIPILGIGAGKSWNAIGNTASAFDVTAYAMPGSNGGSVFRVFFQGYKGEQGAMTPFTYAVHDCQGTAPIKDAVFAPILQTLSVTEGKGADVLVLQTDKNIEMYELVQEIGNRLGEGGKKMFVFTSGTILAHLIRPVKPNVLELASAGGFKAGKDEPTHVIWIPQNGGHYCLTVTTLDPKSYTSIHSHMVSHIDKRQGGHLHVAVSEKADERRNNPILGMGTYILVATADEYRSYDPKQ